MDSLSLVFKCLLFLSPLKAPCINLHIPSFEVEYLIPYDDESEEINTGFDSGWLQFGVMVSQNKLLNLGLSIDGVGTEYNFIGIVMDPEDYQKTVHKHTRKRHRG
jgi:hypothetical protein